MAGYYTTARRICLPQRKFHFIVTQQQMSFLQADRVVQMAPVEEQRQLSIMSQQKKSQRSMPLTTKALLLSRSQMKDQLFLLFV